MSVTNLEQDPSSTLTVPPAIDLQGTYEELALAQDPQKISELVSLFISYAKNAGEYEF